MKILLLGEYSNVHWTLAEGLRVLGHEVTVVSDGDGWKDYHRDIDLKRKSLGKWDTLRYLWKLECLMPNLKGYDVVQLINPMFLELRVERIWPYYKRLRQQNRSVFLGAFGVDYYWVKAGLDCHTFRYSDFNMGLQIRHSAYTDALIEEWMKGEKGQLNRDIAEDCDGIISGLYEYDTCYRPYYREKLQFIPFPIKMPVSHAASSDATGKIRFFIGIQKGRSAYKGTDVMLRALNHIQQKYPEKAEVIQAESVPYPIYQKMIEGSDVLLDQLYSYTPAMNGLLAMSKGIVLVGGGEEESYALLGEQELRPIVNVRPSEQDVYERLEELVLDPGRIPLLKRQSIEYIRRHHEYVKVAREYCKFWTSKS